MFLQPEEDEENPKYEEIKKMLKSLFTQLDALSSWHYTPTQV
jgi:U3 small nucleolar RNA-associated protein MPP10